MAEHVSADAPRVQRLLGLLKSELQVTASLLMEVLGTELGSSPRAVSALDHSVISPTLSFSLSLVSYSLVSSINIAL